MLPDEAFRPWGPAPAPFPEASRPDPAAVLDYDALRASASADEQLMREMMTLFIVGCPRLMERIGDAIAAGDAIKLHAAADALRGSATTIAAVRVADAARVLERMGSRDRLTNATQALTRLEFEVGCLEHVLTIMKVQL